MLGRERKIEEEGGRRKRKLGEEIEKSVGGDRGRKGGKKWGDSAHRGSVPGTEKTNSASTGSASTDKELSVVGLSLIELP